MRKSDLIIEGLNEAGVCYIKEGKSVNFYGKNFDFPISSEKDAEELFDVLTDENTLTKEILSLKLDNNLISRLFDITGKKYKTVGDLYELDDMRGGKKWFDGGDKLGYTILLYLDSKILYESMHNRGFLKYVKSGKFKGDAYDLRNEIVENIISTIDKFVKKKSQLYSLVDKSKNPDSYKDRNGLGYILDFEDYDSFTILVRFKIIYYEEDRETQSRTSSDHKPYGYYYADTHYDRDGNRVRW